MLDAVQGVLTVLSMILLGYVLSRRGWFEGQTSGLFSKLVIKVSLPALIVSNLLNTFDKAMLLEAGMGVLVPMVCMLLLYGVGLLLARILNMPSYNRGIFVAMFAFSNTIFVGLPINVALFGEESTIYALLYYFANTALFWTIGIGGMLQSNGKGNGLSISGRLKNFMSPPLISFIFSLLLIFLNISLPRFVMDALKYIGNLTTPLSMLYIGMVVNSVAVEEVKFNKDMLAILLGRFVMAPLLILIFMYFLPLPVLMKKVFVIQASMPTMTQIAIVSQAYGTDYKYAATMVTVTTVASLFFIPLYMIVLNVF